MRLSIQAPSRSSSFVLRSLAALTLLGGAAQAQSWWSHDPMPTPRTRMAVAAAKHNTSNYAIFTFGGTDGGLTTYSTVEMFNPLTQDWHTKASMPATKSSLTAATGETPLGQRIFVFGGALGASGTTTVWEYDAIADSWNTSLPPLPKPLKNLSATTASNGLIYVFGGYDDVPPYHSNEVFAFDPMLGIWNTDTSWSLNIPDMPRRRSKHAAVTACDGLIYLMGGGNSSGAVLEMDVYDPLTNTWVADNPYTATGWASLMGPRDLEVGGTVGRDGLLYLVGGDGYPYETGNLDSYDRNTNTWSAETTQPTPRVGQVAIGIGNSVYAIGGWKKYGGVQTATEAWGGLPSDSSCGGIVHVNPPGVNYCQAVPNSVSPVGTTITGHGTPSVALNELRLMASPVPPSPGLFFYGPNQVAVPLGEGLLCVGGGIQRLDVSFPQNGTLLVDLGSAGQDGVSMPSEFQPGSTWNLQCWYRDVQGGPHGYNLSDGYTITFTP